MASSDDDPWWTRTGIKARWDENRNTGPQKVVLAKLAWEGAIPFTAALVAGAILSAIAWRYSMVSTEMISIIVGVIGGVFSILYFKAGFKDSTIRET